MKAKLTTRYVNSLKPQDKMYAVRDTELKKFFIRVFPSGTITYYLNYRHNGTGKDYKIGRKGEITATMAREIAEVKCGELAKGVDIQAEKQKAKKREQAAKYQTLGGFITEMYKPWVLAERKTGQATLDILARDFSHMNSRNMAGLGAWDLQKWRTEKLKSGMKPVTVNRRVTALKAVLSKAVEWQVIQHHPLSNVKPLKVDKLGKVRYLRDDEETRLREALDKHEANIRKGRANGNLWRELRGYALKDSLEHSTFADYLKPMVLLARNTGMRRGELFTLTWDNVSFTEKLLTIEGVTAKSGSTRHIPLNDEALGVLIAWRNQSDDNKLVFPNPNTGKKFDNIKKSWATLIKLAGIKDFRFHDLRHHFASSLVMAGADLNTVRELLGHSDLTMTLRYAHLAPEHRAAAVALLDQQ